MVLQCHNTIMLFLSYILFPKAASQITSLFAPQQGTMLNSFPLLLSASGIHLIAIDGPIAIHAFVPSPARSHTSTLIKGTDVHKHFLKEHSAFLDENRRGADSYLCAPIPGASVAHRTRSLCTGTYTHAKCCIRKWLVRGIISSLGKGV